MKKFLNIPLLLLLFSGCYHAPDECKVVSKLLLIDHDLKQFNNELFIKDTFEVCINKKQKDYERRNY